MPLDDSGTPGAAQFPSTSWSALRQLRDDGEADVSQPLAHLAKLYWKPIHCVIHTRWSRSSDEARDLTQEFFSRVLLDRRVFQRFAPEQGSFRSYLRGALGNFMSNIVRDASRLKRGGQTVVVSLEGEALAFADLAPGVVPSTPEEIFDLAWDGFVLRESFALVRARLEGSGRADHFEAFRRHDLASHGDERSHGELAQELGWTVRKLRRVLTEVRGMLREALTELVCQYVEGPEALVGELRRLLGK